MIKLIKQLTIANFRIMVLQNKVAKLEAELEKLRNSLTKQKINN